MINKTLGILCMLCIIMLNVGLVCAEDAGVSNLGINTTNNANSTLEISNNTSDQEYQAGGIGEYDPRDFGNSQPAADLLKDQGVQLMAAASLPSTFTMTQVAQAAISTQAFFRANMKLPNYVTIDGVQVTMPELLYLMTKVIQYKNNGVAPGSPVPFKKFIQDPLNPSGGNTVGTLTKAQYVAYANTLISYMDTNCRAPGYATHASLGGNVPYQTVIWYFCKIMNSTYYNGNMPDSIAENTAQNNPINLYFPRHSRDGAPSNVLNDNYAGTSSAYSYLVSTTNCQVGDSNIQAKANTFFTQSDLQKAIGIFTYVRGKIYDFYYNTKYGASAAYKNSYLNCVDMAHLSIALFRAAGLPARYVHGTCTFNSGNTYGHVWAQVLIGNTWVTSDTSSSANSLGVVNNWNKATYTLHGKYAQITF